MKLIKKVIATVCLTTVGLVSIPANAQLSVFTEHQVIHMFQHGTNNDQDVRFPTGKIPYLGQVGLEYQFNKRVSTTLSYIHRSNADLTGQDEYNYNGVALGIKLSECIYKCK